LTINSTNKFSIVTICNWDTYQNCNINNDKQVDKQAENKRQTNDNEQDCKELKNVKNKSFIIPSIEELKAYCVEKNFTVDCQYFWNWYSSKNWMVGSNKMSNWKISLQLSKEWDINKKYQITPENEYEQLKNKWGLKDGK
jgi:hypothetical protein